MIGNGFRNGVHTELGQDVLDVIADSDITHAQPGRDLMEILANREMLQDFVLSPGQIGP